MVSRLAQAFLVFLRDEDGPTTVEYAVQLGFIIALCSIAINNLGNKTTASFNTVGSQLGNKSSSSGS
jgi:Flp pilus assembly pilin Flp